MNAVYAGCGTDVLPLLLVGARDHVTKFVYLDSQPRSEFGHDARTGFERPRFVHNLRVKLDRLGFREAWRSECPSEPNIVFSNPVTRVEVSLWHSTALPLQNPSERLLAELRMCQVLFVCGHDPHASLLNVIKPNPILITDFKTIVHQDGENVQREDYPTVTEQGDKTFSDFFKICAPRDIRRNYVDFLDNLRPQHKALFTLQRSPEKTLRALQELK